MTERAEPSPTLLEVTDARVHFPIRSSGLLRRVTGHVKAVDGVSLTLARGETLGVVGESGSGKTTLGKALLGLVPLTSGSIDLQGVRVGPEGQVPQRYRSQLQMVFQDPQSSLDPRMTVGDSIAEPLRVHGAYRGHEVGELLEAVGLPRRVRDEFPHALSGGQRQRVVIARALSLRPAVIVCDEPLASLDVSIQAQILRLLERLREERSLSYFFIAHDLAVVRHISDRIAVMHHGRVVELAGCDALYERPLHSYTRRLLSAIPLPDPQAERRRRSERLAAGRTRVGAEREGDGEQVLAEVEPGHWVARAA